MRNRVTWKGFSAWLAKKNNNTLVERKSCKRCPVALYLRNVFNVSENDVHVSYGIMVVKDRVVSAPGILRQFPARFDERAHRLGSKISTAKLVVKELNKEHNIV